MEGACCKEGRRAINEPQVLEAARPHQENTFACGTWIQFAVNFSRIRCWLAAGEIRRLRMVRFQSWAISLFLSGSTIFDIVYSDLKPLCFRALGHE